MNLTRTYKTIAFSLPPEMAERVNVAARGKQLTKSEFFRELFRTWEQNERLSMEEQLTRFRQLSKEGYQQATSLGMNVEDEEEINRIVYESRQARRRENRITSRS